MIVVKPKINTLLSLGIFITICLSVSGYTLSIMMRSGNIQWYQYLIVLILTPLALGILFKTLLGYKRVEVGKNKITIYHPIRFSSQSYLLKEVKQWTEQKVKTGGSTFKELTILFDSGKKLSLSLQEHTNYLDLLKYLKKKCSRQYLESK